MSLSFGDKELLVLSDYMKVSTIRVYDFDQIMRKKDDETPKVTLQITAKKEQAFNYAIWGPLNKSIYVATDQGRVIVFDKEGN